MSYIFDGPCLKIQDESENRKLFFFQLPKKLPLDKRPASTKGKEKAESSKPLGRTDAPKDLDLSKLPGGYMGKMLVYKSGAVKFKLGDTLFDVSTPRFSFSSVLTCLLEHIHINAFMNAKYIWETLAYTILVKIDFTLNNFLQLLFQVMIDSVVFAYMIRLNVCRFQLVQIVHLLKILW